MSPVPQWQIVGIPKRNQVNQKALEKPTFRVTNVALLVECLPNMLGSIPALHINWVWLCTPAIPALGTRMQEEQKLKLILQSQQDM